MTIKKLADKHLMAVVMGLMALSTVAMALEPTDTPMASFESLDANKDGRISVSEARRDKTVAGRFAAADTDQDGYLDKKEFETIARK